MQITFFSFIMSLLWFNLYIIIINMFRKNDDFIISFSGLPIIFFLFLSIFRLIFNFEIQGSVIIQSKTIFTTIYDFIRMPLSIKHFNINVSQLIFSVWILGVIILLTKTMKKYTSFKRIIGKLKKQQTEETEQVFKKILNENGMNKRIKIIQNDNISSPFILGILKGNIYIPDIDFSEEEYEHIILHEINHFLANDSLKKILIQSIRILFWWNPLAHLFANDFNQILEIQCDLKTTVNFPEEEKLRYLESITKIIKKCIKVNIESSKYVTVPSFVEIEELDSLKQRFHIVLNYKTKKKVFNIILYILATFLFISSYFFIIQPDYKPSIDGIYNKKDENNSFIIENLKGSYDIYIDNIFKYSIKNLEDLNKRLSDLPIIQRRSRLK